jgi:hypothetical protein
MSKATSRCDPVEVRMGKKITDALQGLAEVEREVFRVFLEETEHV